MNVALAATHHDPEGRLLAQTARMLPQLRELFPRITLRLTSTTVARAEKLVLAHGVDLVREQEAPGGLTQLGRPRRAVVARALEQGAQHVVFCDFDRVLHWAEFYPVELAEVVTHLPEADFTVLGRSEQAFASHPRCQRDTEAPINTVFAAVSGHAWDTGAGARGLSRRAAEAVLAGCADESVGVDVTWPLFLLRQGGFNLTYRATEGLEFETADRYADQVATCGGLNAWIDRIDRDPRQWALRLELARVEVQAIADCGLQIAD